MLYVFGAQKHRTPYKQLRMAMLAHCWAHRWVHATKRCILAIICLLICFLICLRGMLGASVYFEFRKGP